MKNIEDASEARNIAKNTQKIAESVAITKANNKLTKILKKISEAAANGRFHIGFSFSNRLVAEEIKKILLDKNFLVCGGFYNECSPFFPYWLTIAWD